MRLATPAAYAACTRRIQTRCAAEDKQINLGELYVNAPRPKPKQKETRVGSWGEKHEFTGEVLNRFY